jgi:hypothetical protein
LAQSLVQQPRQPQSAVFDLRAQWWINASIVSLPSFARSGGRAGAGIMPIGQP